MGKHKHGRSTGKPEQRKKMESRETKVPSSETESVAEAQERPVVDAYDGYYEDRTPCDTAALARPIDYGMVKQLILIGIGFAVIVAASIAVMYLL